MRRTRDELVSLASAALQRAGAHATMAEAVAGHLVLAGGQVLHAHDISRVPFCCGMLKRGRADGAARPYSKSVRGAVCPPDNEDALPCESCAWAIREALAGTNPVAVVLPRRSDDPSRKIESQAHG